MAYRQHVVVAAAKNRIGQCTRLPTEGRVAQAAQLIRGRRTSAVVRRDQGVVPRFAVKERSKEKHWRVESN